MNNSNNQDIIITGAGLVGAVQALLFAKAGFNVAVIERSALRSIQNSSQGSSDNLSSDAISSRTVALSHRSWQLLSSAGLWPDVECWPIKTVHVTAQGRFGSVKIHAERLEVEALGYVVPNAGFENYLHTLIEQATNIKVIEHASVVSVENHQQSVAVTFEQSGLLTTLNAQLAIAADGTHSAIRKMLRIETRQHHYQQCAVHANVQTAKSLSGYAFERFTDEGPLALLPLSSTAKSGGDHLYSMIYTAAASEANRLTEASDQEFLHLLQQKFGGRLGRFEKVGRRFVTPLMLTVSEKQIEGRCVLIGNAARTLHPVAGQGMNLALRDVFELTSCIVGELDRSPANTVENPADIHAVDKNETIETALAAFKKRRSRDQWRVTRQTDLLARAFTAKPWPVRMPLSLLASSSFLVLDFISPLKKAFAVGNMGRHVPLPPNAQPANVHTDR